MVSPCHTRVIGHSVLSSWIRSICQTVRGYGIDPLVLMDKAGLDTSLLNIPEARYPVQAMRRFWYLVIQATDNPLIGLKVGQEIQMSSLHSLGFAMMSSSSLSELLMLFVRYAKILSTTMQPSFEHDIQGTTLVFRTQDGDEPRASAKLACIALLYRQACSLSQHSIIPKFITLSLPYNSEISSELDEYFHTSVTLGAEQDSISFCYQDTIEPYASANAQLTAINEMMAREYLSKLGKNDFSGQVLMHIQNALSKEEPKLSDIAAALNITPRTLQRRLREENHNFQELLDSERKNMAHEMLAHTNRSIVEISYMLGFSDPSNLCRASQRWFGHSPTEHRKICLNIQT